MPAETQLDMQQIAEAEEAKKAENAALEAAPHQVVPISPEERFQAELAEARAANPTPPRPVASTPEQSDAQFKTELEQAKLEHLAKLRGESEEKYRDQLVTVNTELSNLDDITAAIRSGNQLTELQKYRLDAAQKSLVDFVTQYGINTEISGVRTPKELSLGHLIKVLKPQDVLTIVDQARKAALYDLTREG